MPRLTVSINIIYRFSLNFSMIPRIFKTKFSTVFLAGIYLFHYTKFSCVDSVNSSKLRDHENSTSCAAYVSQLNEENKKLQQELQLFIHKNEKLRSEISHIQGQCNATLYCESNGHIYQNGDLWYPDACSTCKCKDGLSQCYTSYHSSECRLECSESMCLNGGTCHVRSFNSVQCNCPEGYSGPVCEQSNCIPVKLDGTCDQKERTWYFDFYSNLCKPADSDCYDPRSSFTSYEACSVSCLQGTCCYRMKIGEITDMICQTETMENCQLLCQEEKVEVIGFYPGISCPEEGCAMIATKTCHTGIALYSPGAKFSFGCDACECLEKQIICNCRALSVRKEIRQLRNDERIQYQRTIAKLQIGNEKGIWNSLRNLYVTHIMHANSPLYFLFWNRIFLRTMERHLQEFDCSLTIPYFDFTLDAGNLSASVVWGDDYFGSPRRNISICNHYFVPNSDLTWTPCIRRSLKSENNIPTMVDVAIALSKTDFFEFTSAIQGIVNYLHSFIGGDMETEGGPNDPVFYSLHAYVDMLFWKWQNKHFQRSPSIYNDKILHALLSPFNTEQQFLMDSERDLCVSYKSIGENDQYEDQGYNFNYNDYNSVDHDILSSCFTENNECYENDLRAILNAGHHIQTMLYNQDENFLKTVPRTCNFPSAIPTSYVNQGWNVNISHFKASPNLQPVDRITDWCKRFCFTADIFLPPENTSVTRVCHSKQVPICDESVLLKCPYYTYAPCRLSLCGNCSLTCHVNNQDIDCSESQLDFCSSNPCKNGGICQPSRWTSLPHLISCDCLPGFEGEFCEEISQKRCFLPQNPGITVDGCGSPEKRWYFNYETQDCHSFHYRGCSGNANNFLSYYECRVSCIIGACCWRMHLFPNNIYGFSKKGYDRYGFDTKGVSEKNERRTFDNGYGGEKNIFRLSGLDSQGYDRHGFNAQGLDRFGYNAQGFHFATKFNLTGYDALGDHDGLIEFDESGYNEDGYDRAGLNCFGYTKDGWDYYGLATGWSFECRAMNLKDCQNVENEFPRLQRKVIAFSPGKKCEEVNCEQLCGCNFLWKSIPVGTKFPLGCNLCECSRTYRINCSCTTTNVRKEIRDLTYEELIRYQNAIKTLILQKAPSSWQNLTNLYKQSLPASRGNPFFLPWHRFFLRYAEMKLQEIDCSVTIPYFDFTLDIGNLESSIIWQANMFGGNGDKVADYCVKHHPFKKIYSTQAVGCLRRNFNVSVQLPNAVDIEKLIREDTYEEFNSQLDKISSLFHLFVGGHMTTPDSVFDPIFFSFYAFIDKIWYDWIISNPKNVEKFPQELRYILMIPFGIAPDDVLLSMTQLCVSYVQNTAGAICNVGSTYVDDRQEHGTVLKQIFDIDGYDSEGYDKYGFDRSGWNRNGFNRDSFNRDGFDTFGYDRQGYNRYGLDRHGCNIQGLCFFEKDLKADEKNNNAPWDDFNELGFRRTGLDFHGYDIYGFNTHGFDKENCSYFFKGPFYPKIMKDIKLKLKEMKADDLDKIPRICPDVSALPTWWLNMYWLNRNANEISIGTRHSPTVKNFSPFSTSGDLRLAPTPDERFCFPLQIHTKCKLHKPPVPCPFIKCNIPFCPTKPSAVCRSFGCETCEEHFLNVVSQTPTICNKNGCFVNGTVRNDGENWIQDLCHKCTCKAGLVSCSHIPCDVPCDHPILMPNTCCPVCDGCMKDRISFSNGDAFIDPVNPCLKCHCQNGTILCAAVECAPMKPCRKNAVMNLPGECCPKCSMCGPHHEGSHWMESPCHNCTCESGNVHCTVISCPVPICHYPARDVGECCRHCDDCEYGGSYVRNQEIFYPGGCQECQCQKGNVTCKTISCAHRICQDENHPENKCCELCKKGCLYDGIEYNDGESFNPSFNPCLNCSCEKSLVRCQPVTCPRNEISCESPVFLPGKCCPECPSCSYQNEDYPNGARWRASNDSCEICKCIDGNVFCSEKDTCSGKKCTHGVIPKGACCSPCRECKYNNHVVTDQTQFSPPHDPCARCACRQGNITCMRETCPKLLCHITELPPGACCPICKGCANNIGQSMEHGQKWIHPTDVCQICSCENGNTRCERVECEVPCTHPVKQPNQCCSECNDCQVSGRKYDNNAEIPSTDPCKRCFCYRGSMECELLRCPTVTCDNPEKRPGECCPTCEVCKFQGGTYEDGQKFQPKSDSCYYCICDKGAVQCDRKDKCNPQCSDPVKLPNQCCPVCDGCEYEGKAYKNRQRFMPNPYEACLKCECINGNVQCFQEQCPKLNCSNPVKSPNQCCGECPEVCFDKANNKTYEKGEMWVPGDDPCKICTCESSQPICKPYECPTPNCLHAAAPFGICCRECDHCEFTNRLYRNGQEFTHADDPCQICKCQNGSVTCETIHCDPLPCMHPEDLAGLCCPVCAPEIRCHYLGKTYEAWENFMDPTNPCSECVCIDGMVSCHQVLCLNSECPNPQLGHCCESCDGCSYGEKNYMNHISFHDPFSQCRECKCNNGIVSCQQTSCDSSSCDHPVYRQGECCPVCDAKCVYKDQMYVNGESFFDPDDPCIDCYCQYPDVYCQVYDCEESSCDDPLRSKCCSSCGDCNFFDISYESGASFPHPQNPCETCNCQEGAVTCFEMNCPPPKCSHPVRLGCCMVCNEGCLYNNTFYKELDVFVDLQNPCNECTCKSGNVICQPKKCPSVTCKYPSKHICCAECFDCFYEGELIKNGNTVDYDGSDNCSECICSNGDIECIQKPCPAVYCSDPVIHNCCPVCHLGCLYDNKIYKFGAEFDHPKDSCSECVCMDGSVHCDRKPCEPVNCKFPIIDDIHCCPYCPDYCMYEGKTYGDNSVFPDNSDICKDCKCLAGDITCETRTCPEVLCLHPAAGKCCMECEKCEFYGEIYYDGRNFTNPNDPCESCLCTKGQVACRKNSCVQCLHPLLSESLCCPLCDGCFYKGINYTNQELFIDPSSPCEECICKNGTVTCHELSCSLPSCSEPVYLPGVCCPVCPGCTFDGVQFKENDEFTHPNNVCEKCVCKDSHVACKTQICHRNCTHAIPDPCCPICDGCMFETVKYSNGQTFNPDPCHTCECKDGNVLCISEQCPELQCQLRIRLLGECCETCRGCFYEGIEYENGVSWFSSSNPCLSCSCNGGTVSCKNVVCAFECAEPIPVPGICCPVCPECEKEGKKYKSGEVFAPDDYPCDTCTCDSGHIFCIRHECPTLIGCPEEAIKPPGEGECCPTCAAFGTSCTRDQIGKLFYPSGDPCFSCQCSENFMWVCSKEFCAHLNCPADEIVTSEKECCPKCKVCLSEGVEIHAHGDSWIPSNDVCTLCFCDYGHTKCNKIACPKMKCQDDEFEYQPSGECCPICTSSRDLSCDYGGSHYEHGQTWNPDPCTICQCAAGKMNCQNERCLPLHCSSDEIKSVDPGQCCPKCIPRPATCLAFGDPHYRTFDGAAISFQGTCRYVLTADCSTQKFNILVENNDRGFNGVSWTHRVVVVLQNASVDLRSGPLVYVKGKQIDHLPYFEDPVLYVEKTGSSVLVTTNVGVQVFWNGDGYVEVIVSGIYRDKTCGLCGNFNNFPEDDMRTPTNDIVNSEAEFGNSWKNPGVQPEGCTDSVDIDPCSKGGYRIRKIANSKCSILKQSLFASCHRFIPPESYFAACVYDVCACSENDNCLCDILSAYSKECSKAGIILHWRSEGLCGISCPYEEGLVFDECGPPCPRTCENRNLPIGILASQCFKPCVPGCQCSADKVLHNGRCIRPNKCP